VICKYADKNLTYCNSCGYPVNVCGCTVDNNCEKCGEVEVSWAFRGQRLCKRVKKSVRTRS